MEEIVASYFWSLWNKVLLKDGKDGPVVLWLHDTMLFNMVHLFTFLQLNQKSRETLSNIFRLIKTDILVLIC